MCEVPCLAFQALRDEGEIPGLMGKVRICTKSYQGHTVGDRLSAVQEGSQCFSLWMTGKASWRVLFARGLERLL